MTKVKSYMAEANITNVELASALGISQSAVSLRTRGFRKWTPKELVALIKIFRKLLNKRIELWDLVEEDEDADSNLDAGDADSEFVPE